MAIACSWCKRGMGIKPCDPASHGGTSHSICPACKTRVMEAVIEQCRQASPLADFVSQRGAMNTPVRFSISRINMSNTTAPVLSRRRIAEIVGPEAAVLVGRIERQYMEFGTHHRWTDEQVFTAAGVEMLVEKLAEVHAETAAALRAVASVHFNAPPVAELVAADRVRISREMHDRELVAPVHGRARVAHSPLNGYVPELD